MTTDKNRLHKDFQAIVDLDKQTRIESLHQNIWINYPMSENIINLLNHMLKRPKKPRVQGLLIIGESNMGKTSILHRFTSQHPDITYEDEAEMTRVQKYYIHAIMKGPNEKDLYISILEQFWTPFRPTDALAKLRHQVMNLMKQCSVKMLILDEIHNLLSGTATKQRAVMDALKNLSVELMIPIVCVGTKEAALILTTDPQQASRFDIVRLPSWKLDKNFRALLVAFEKRLPLRKASNLDKKDKAPLLYSLSGGNLGNLHRLLIECATYAIESEEEEITVEIINKMNWIKPSSARTPREIKFDNA
jgi:hypothetical protein